MLPVTKLSSRLHASSTNENRWMNEVLIHESLHNDWKLFVVARCSRHRRWDIGHGHADARGEPGNGKENGRERASLQVAASMMLLCFESSLHELSLLRSLVFALRDLEAFGATCDSGYTKPCAQSSTHPAALCAHGCRSGCFTDDTLLYCFPALNVVRGELIGRGWKSLFAAQAGAMESGVAATQ